MMDENRKDEGTAGLVALFILWTVLMLVAGAVIGASLESRAAAALEKRRKENRPPPVTTLERS